jgi:hypothetical protein
MPADESDPYLKFLLELMDRVQTLIEERLAEKLSKPGRVNWD